jgi:hypothetical protein
MNKLLSHNRMARVVVTAMVMLLSSTALAVPPNPMESAYWRFEEGSNFSPVNHAIADPVRDSINANHLDVFNAAAAPIYTDQAAPTALKSGLTNTLALDFIRGGDGSDDLFTLYADGDHGKGLAKNINNGIIAPGGGITVEAAFNVTNLLEFQAIMAKEGQPGLGRGLGFIENLPTFAVKTRPPGNPADFRQGRLQVEMWDGAGNITDIVSNNTLNTDQWYYFAVVSNGSTGTVELWLDSNDGNGYQLQGSPNPISGALYQGPDPQNPSWDNSWTVGRAQFGGGPADFFDGRIDEVRITNAALSPSQFLFAPPGGDGDHNEDGVVDAADYVAWRKLDIDGQAGYDDFYANFGETVPGSGGGSSSSPVPEPTVLALGIVAACSCGMMRRRQRSA